MRAVQIRVSGGPDVLEFVELPEPEPDRHDVVIDVAAAGLNFIDTYHRRGLYPREFPFVLGGEAAGVVSAVGGDVTTVGVGDRVVTTAAAGSYAERAVAKAGDVFHIPAGVDLDVAAAVALQGFTAHYLVRNCHPLREGDRLLVHAGAGGVGGLLIQMAKIVGAEVFTTVSSAAKADEARSLGADHVIDYTDTSFVEAVREIAGEDRPLDVVYDGVGRDTFDDGLTLLRPRGILVLFGQSSGPVPPVDLQVLARNGSLLVTRPTLGDFMTADEAPWRAEEVFGWIADGRLRVRIGARYPLAEAAEAHRALEGRRTSGKVLLVP